jgi:hypothetical protein
MLPYLFIVYTPKFFGNYPKYFFFGRLICIFLTLNYFKYTSDFNNLYSIIKKNNTAN